MICSFNLPHIERINCNNNLGQSKRVIQFGNSQEKKIFKKLQSQYIIDCIMKDIDICNEDDFIQYNTDIIVNYFDPDNPKNIFTWRFKTLDILIL